MAEDSDDLWWVNDSFALARLKGSRFECDKEVARALKNNRDEISEFNKLLQEQEEETEYWKYEAKYADKLDTISLYKKERKNNQKLRKYIRELTLELDQHRVGLMYVGEWKNDKWHGQGTLTFASGGEYVGEFKDNERHGEGTYTSADGRKCVVEFRDGKLVGPPLLPPPPKSPDDD
jgi:hypothetical protein